MKRNLQGYFPISKERNKEGKLPAIQPIKNRNCIQ